MPLPHAKFAKEATTLGAMIVLCFLGGLGVGFQALEGDGAVGVPVEDVDEEGVAFDGGAAVEGAAALAVRAASAGVQP